MKKYFRKNFGFTLIELLVVISIIGLLSSIVLAALSSARLKGKSGAIQSEMIQVRNFMEINRDANGSYLTDFVYLSTNSGALLAPGAAYYYFNSVGQCGTIISTGNGAQLQSICNAIVGNGGILYIGGPLDATWTPHTVYSIEALLPGTNTYSCIGSSGKNSSGHSSADYSNSGCLANP
jgi:prepilin-type N-terminal cleavage/methylation domain-containing protein